MILSCGKKTEILNSEIATLTEEIVYYYSHIGSYLKAVRAIAEIWNSMLSFYSGS